MSVVVPAKEDQVGGGFDEGPPILKPVISDHRVKDGMEQSVREISYLWGSEENPFLYLCHVGNSRIFLM